METIRGLTALGLVALAVFTGVFFFNRQVAADHNVKLQQIAHNDTGRTLKQAAIGKSSSAVAHQKNQKSRL